MYCKLAHGRMNIRYTRRVYTTIWFHSVPGPPLVRIKFCPSSSSSLPSPLLLCVGSGFCKLVAEVSVTTECGNIRVVSLRNVPPGRLQRADNAITCRCKYLLITGETIRCISVTRSHCIIPVQHFSRCIALHHTMHSFKGSQYLLLELTNKAEHIAGDLPGLPWALLGSPGLS